MRLLICGGKIRGILLYIRTDFSEDFSIIMNLIDIQDYFYINF